MRIVFFVFDQITTLDAIGPYDVLALLPGAEVLFVSRDGAPVVSDKGAFHIAPTASIRDVHSCDILLVPGGVGTVACEHDAQVLAWLRALDETSKLTTSVCTGALLLAAAGMLRGRRATTHWAVRERLADYGALPVAERVVRDGKYVTAAGVSAGIDMALSVTEQLAGREHAEALQLLIEYDPHPPFDSGNPERARAGVRDRMRQRVVKRRADALATLHSRTP